MPRLVVRRKVVVVDDPFDLDEGERVVDASPLGGQWEDGPTPADMRRWTYRVALTLLCQADV